MAVPNQYQYQQYQQQQIFTASPEKLLIMLYDGAIRFCARAGKAIENKNFPEANENCIKVENIIMELKVTLNMDYEIAQNLNSLYDYLYRRMVDANLNKDIAILDEVSGFLRDLRHTWAEASLLAKK